MFKNILMATLTVTSCFALAAGEILVHEINDKSEVKVSYINESACILNYVDRDYLTREKTPIFYTFQVEVNEAQLQHGMISWLPYGLSYGQPSTLAFHDAKNKMIYEYTEKASEYGAIFYSTDLFSQFLNAEKIYIMQKDVTKNMPLYGKANISNSATQSFQQCIVKLEKVLKNYCSSSPAAKKKCADKQSSKQFPGLVIKDYPSVIAERAMLAAQENAIAEAKKLAKVKEQAEAKKLAKAKAEEENKANLLAKTTVPAKTLTDTLVVVEPHLLAAVNPYTSVKETYKAKEKKILPIFSDKLEVPFKLKKYVQHDNVLTSNFIDEERGNVMRIRYLTDKGVVFYASDEGADYSGYNFLEFDLNVSSDPRSNGGFMIKMDCFHPCTSGNYSIEKPTLGSWKHYKIKLNDLVSMPGSNLDLRNVNTPFAILPDWGKQRGVVLMVDNVNLTD